MKTAAQAARMIEDYRSAMPVAILRGLRRGLQMAKRLALTRYMQRKDNRGFDPPNPPPGPLAIRQGNLARTVRVGDMRWSGRKVTGTLEAGSGEVLYARIHEMGGLTGRGGRVLMPARPYLRPALDDPETNIVGFVRDELLRTAKASLRGLARVRGA